MPHGGWDEGGEARNQVLPAESGSPPGVGRRGGEEDEKAEEGGERRGRGGRRRGGEEMRRRWLNAEGTAVFFALLGS